MDFQDRSAMTQEKKSETFWDVVSNLLNTGFYFFHFLDPRLLAICARVVITMTTFHNVFSSWLQFVEFFFYNPIFSIRFLHIFSYAVTAWLWFHIRNCAAISLHKPFKTGIWCWKGGPKRYIYIYIWQWQWKVYHDKWHQLNTEWFVTHGFKRKRQDYVDGRGKYRSTW